MCLIGPLGIGKRYAARVLQNWSKDARGLGGAKVGSPVVFSVSGLTSLDSPPGGAGGGAAMPHAGIFGKGKRVSPGQDKIR